MAKGVPIALVLGIVWDYIAISRGWWSYGKDFLFFILVPAGAVAVYDLINNPSKKRIS